MDALVIGGFEALRAQLAGAEGASAAARLDAIVLAYLRFGLAQPQHYRLMFVRPAAEKRGDPAVVQAASHARQELEAAVTAWLQQSGQPLDLVEEVAVSLWTLAHGFVMLAVEGHLPRAGVEALCQAAVRRMLSVAG